MLVYYMSTCLQTNLGIVYSYRFLGLVVILILLPLGANEIIKKREKKKLNNRTVYPRFCLYHLSNAPKNKERSNKDKFIL